jgi:hypothetical protein
MRYSGVRLTCLRDMAGGLVLQPQILTLPSE